MTILPIQEVFLPLDEAIEEVARQKFDNDVQLGKMSTDEWEQCSDQYREQARQQIENKGHGDRPLYPDNRFIRVKEE